MNYLSQQLKTIKDNTTRLLCSQICERNARCGIDIIDLQQT